jgi:N-acetylmuramoyl-L-alanine amidase
MKVVAYRAVATLLMIATTVLSRSLPVAAQPTQFQQREVDQSRFVAVAAPYRNGNAHQLLILEQLADNRPCWAEYSTQNLLTIVEPLLLEFNFTGLCNRSTDSNGYSIRVNGEDFGLRYSLRIVEHNDDLLLVGAPSNQRAPHILIGRTSGITDDFAKINLNPGWRFTQRTFNNRGVGHVYLTYDGDLTATLIDGINAGNLAEIPPPAPRVTARFADTRQDIYLEEINQAVAIGFIAGFNDNTFRPTAPLTREQLVSMVIEAIERLPDVTLTVPAQAAGNPYTDVSSDRWSAAKIAFAQQNTIVSGYQDGSFRPAQPVTRAELMAILRRAADYARSLQGQPSLSATQAETPFSDTNGHWASLLIAQMSAVCRIATPLNEQGTVFAPDRPAQRNYAAAATLRMVNCVSPSDMVDR